MRALAIALLCFGAAAVAKAQSDCIDVWGEARYRNYGYDHVVHVNNRCEQPALCNVATTVNPTPVRIAVAPKQEAEVLTFRGSPSREFTPRVDCEIVSSQ